MNRRSHSKMREAMRRMRQPNKARKKTSGLIVMGVAGCGKTTIGRELAAQLGWDFFDADEYHPPENIAKMSAGIPLNDEDRAPWLAALRELLAQTLHGGRHPVLACSALKEKYRRTLLDGNRGIRIVFLKGGFDLILSRMNERSGHYMKPEMLRSQFDALEEPANAVTVDIAQQPEKIVESILRKLKTGEKGLQLEDE